MGQLLEGKWVEDSYAKRMMEENRNLKNMEFKGKIKGKVDPENEDRTEFKAEVNRYHLYLSYGCPWASRVSLMWCLKGLEDMISASFVNPYLGELGWSFKEYEGVIGDPIINAEYLSEIYILGKKNYTGRVSVPVLWDKKTSKIVSNESLEIMKMLNMEFNHLIENDEKENRVVPVPENMKEEMEILNNEIQKNICMGVYKVGNARTQEMYDSEEKKLFSCLDYLEKILGERRYLAGDNLTESDVMLFPFLVRFDTVYANVFKCSRKRIVDYPNLWRYLKEMYNMKKVKKTVNMDHIKRTYYGNQKLNPRGIIPAGPDLKWEE